MKRFVGVGLAVAAVAIVVFVVVRLGHGPPAGPVPIAWDDEPCAECRMHVGDPAFAAQLQTEEGDVLAFDDPGCLFLYQTREKPRVHAIYFHARTGDRWLSASQAAFVRVESGSPMGFGLAAVPRGTPDSISLDAARRVALERGTTR